MALISPRVMSKIQEYAVEKKTGQIVLNFHEGRLRSWRFIEDGRESDEESLAAT